MKLGTLCYLRDHDKMLLLHRNKKENDMHEGKWIGLGGKVIPGETPEECIIREYLEESGLELIKPTLRGIITFPKFDGVEDWYVYVFTATEYTGNLITCNEGTLEWVPCNEVLNKPTWEGDLIFLDWLINDVRFFSGKMVYDKTHLISSEVIFYDPL